MYEHSRGLIAFRSFIAAVSVALLAGCLPHNNDPAAAVPSDFTATAGNAMVTLTWTASTGASGYNVKRATTSGGPYTLLATPTTAKYVDTTVTNGTTYYYVVSSLNPGESMNSAQVSAAPELPIPGAPTAVVATAGNATVALTWTASTDAASYNVKRATVSGGPYTTIANTTAPSYTDTTVANGTTYYYVVSALNAAGESANSAQVSATPQIPVKPAAPTNVVASAGNAQVSLTWTASTGATSYNVKRATVSGGPYTTLANTAAPAYTDTTVTNGTTYYYVVSALSAAGESANSAQVSATPQVPVKPTAPTNVVASPGTAQVSLTWTASTGATSYHLKRATASGGPYTQIAAPTATSYTDTAVTDGTTYYYVVSALSTVGESANSAQVQATPFAATPPPATGTWVDVTPSNVDLTSNLCGNFGTQSVQVDPAHPSNLYAEFNCQGIWKSTDYGVTWTGPINTGMNGTTVSDCVGGITVSPSTTATVPTIYEVCIRGNATGFWQSVDGGVDWTQYVVMSSADRQDYYPPVVDPYDLNHLLLAAHEFNSIVESTDGGQTWSSVPLNNGMLQNGATGYIFFINTGTAATSRGNWLWIGQQSGGVIGTWRTTDSGMAWVQVDKNEHPLAYSQIYQPDTSGVVFMAGEYSVLGAGVLRSADYGQTWTHVGLVEPECVVTGTSKDVYGMFGGPGGPGSVTNPSFEVASQPGTGTYAATATPTAMTDGAAQLAVVNDGTHNILLGSMYNAGLWRYIEP